MGFYTLSIEQFYTMSVYDFYTLPIFAAEAPAEGAAQLSLGSLGWPL